MDIIDSEKREELRQKPQSAVESRRGHDYGDGEEVRWREGGRGTSPEQKRYARLEETKEREKRERKEKTIPCTRHEEVVLLRADRRP